MIFRGEELMSSEMVSSANSDNSREITGLAALEAVGAAVEASEAAGAAVEASEASGAAVEVAEAVGRSMLGLAG